MNRFLTLIALTLGLSLPAAADVWKWVDASGKTHFVDTTKAIFTWVDENGKRHYSDTPGHEDAVSVQLVWHSSGTLEDLENPETEDGYAYPGETAEERAEREAADAYYCKRATEIFESYLNAPAPVPDQRGRRARILERQGSCRDRRRDQGKNERTLPLVAAQTRIPPHVVAERTNIALSINSNVAW